MNLPWASYTSIITTTPITDMAKVILTGTGMATPMAIITMVRPLPETSAKPSQLR